LVGIIKKNKDAFGDLESMKILWHAWESFNVTRSSRILHVLLNISEIPELRFF